MVVNKESWKLHSVFVLMRLATWNLMTLTYRDRNNLNTNLLSVRKNRTHIVTSCQPTVTETIIPTNQSEIRPIVTAYVQLDENKHLVL